MQRVQTLEDAWAHKTREDAEKALAVAEKKIKRLETELAKQEEELTQKETEVFVLREVCGAQTVVAPLTVHSPCCWFLRARFDSGCCPTLTSCTYAHELLPHRSRAAALSGCEV